MKLIQMNHSPDAAVDVVVALRSWQIERKLFFIFLLSKRRLGAPLSD